MTVLTACQNACAYVVGRRPTSIYSSQDELPVEMGALANEAATDVMKGNDWQALTAIASVSGDGAKTSFDLPSDFDRMALGGGMNNAVTPFWGYLSIPTADEWIIATTTAPRLTPGGWTMLGGKLQFWPAPSVGAQARYAYISRNYALSGSTPRGAFSADDDWFVLDERLLTLALIWRWRAMKGQNYQEDMRNYEIALSQAQARDRGSRVIRDNAPRRRLSTSLAWPWELG